MDVFFYFVCGIVGIFLLVVIGFPDLLVPPNTARKEKMNASHWGLYEGISPIGPDEQPLTIEVQANRKRHKITAGSQTYAAGRGVKQG